MTSSTQGGATERPGKVSRDEYERLIDAIDYTLTAHGKIDADTPLHDRIRKAYRVPGKSPSPDSKLEAYRKALEDVRPAIENLTNHQEQCDMDGCFVKVSRQALDEVLSAVDIARKALAAGG